MPKATLGDIKLTIDYLLEQQQALILSLSAGKTYLSRLKHLQAEIAALPPAAVLSGKPLAQQLSGVDELHDHCGAALWHLAECYRSLPGAPAETVAAARFIQERLITHLGELKASYADEAAKASERKPLLKGAEGMLAAIPLAGGGSAFSLATAFLGHGEQLAALLGQRADHTAAQSGEGDRTRAGHLRNQGLGLLNRFRGVVADELEADPALPRDLDARLFTFLDQRIAQRADASRESADEGATGAVTPPVS